MPTPKQQRENQPKKLAQLARLVWERHSCPMLFNMVEEKHRPHKRTSD